VRNRGRAPRGGRPCRCSAVPGLTATATRLAASRDTTPLRSMRRGATIVGARGTRRERASIAPVSLAPTVEAPGWEGALRPNMGARQAIETEPHELQWHGPGELGRRTTTPATTAADLEEAILIRPFQRARGVRSRGTTKRRGGGLGGLGTPSRRHEALRPPAAPVMARTAPPIAGFRDRLAHARRRRRSRLRVGVALRIA